jgi:hypothetical protein
MAMMGLESKAVQMRRERLQNKRLKQARLEFIGEYEFPLQIIRVARSFAEQEAREQKTNPTEAPITTSDSLLASLREFLSAVDPTFPQIPGDKRVDALFRVFINDDRLAYVKFCDEAYGVIIEYPKQARAAVQASIKEAQTQGLAKAGWTSSPFPNPKTNKNAKTLAED